MSPQRGFTLVELIMVMVILGILAVVAIPRLFNSTDSAARAFHTDVRSALRYAQKVSTSHRRLVCATVAAKSVTLQISSTNPAAACDTVLPGADGLPYATSNAAVSAGGLTGTLFFQPTGQITTDGNGAALAAGSITITGVNPVRIDGATGHVE